MNKCKECQKDADNECPMNGRTGSHKYCFTPRRSVANELTPELEFCRMNCEPLSHEQEIMVAHHVMNGTFIGVGRAVGRMVFWPMVKRGNSVDVIDRCGYAQFAALDGRKAFKA